jgi:hypothetical protein
MASKKINSTTNKTGIPDPLKEGIEDLSGLSMDEVQVHDNSHTPPPLNAHAYVQGTDLHLGPEQEKHLPHEAWQVVQQKQGRIKPTPPTDEKVPVNNDAGLEKEADVKLEPLSTLSLCNSDGIVEANYPFFLFGKIPAQGSYFIFGSREWLHKNISGVTLHLFWDHHIPADFTRHYAAYDREITNASFQVRFSMLQEGQWEPLNDSTIRLFHENTEGSILPQSTFYVDFDEKVVFTGSHENKDELEDPHNTLSGGIKMELVGPEVGFGHGVYPQVYSKSVLKQAKWSHRLAFWRKSKRQPSLPSAPYTPIVEKMEVRLTHANPE